MRSNVPATAYIGFPSFNIFDIWLSNKRFKQSFKKCSNNDQVRITCRFSNHLAPFVNELEFAISHTFLNGIHTIRYVDEIS